jgi:hypothetical protein
VKGHYFFMDGEMRGAHALKPDKTGKALLTVLRHLGRLQEVCASDLLHAGLLVRKTPCCIEPAGGAHRRACMQACL